MGTDPDGGTGSTLSVYGTRDEVPDEAGPVLVVSEVVADVDEETARSQYGDLFAAEGVDVDGVPVYDLVVHNLWRDGLDVHGTGPYTMNLLVTVNEAVRGRLADGEATSVECHGLDRLYRLAVEDACEAVGVSCSTDARRVDRLTAQARFLLAWLSTALLWLLDAVLSAVLPAPSGGDGSVLLIYPTGRPGTTESVRDRLQVETTYYTLRKQVSAWYHGDLTPPDVDAVAMNRDGSLGTVLVGVRFLGLYVVDTFLTGRTARTLADRVEAETGAPLPRTVDALYRRASVVNLPACLLYRTARRTFRSHRFDGVLITNSASRGKAVALAALEHEVPVYRLPHSISVPYDRFETTTYRHTVFLEGAIGRDALGAQSLVTPVVSGHPKLVASAESLADPYADRETRQQVLLATQPFDDAVRRQFVTDAGRAAQAAGYEVCIKIHPGEDPSFYRSLVAEREALDASSVRVETGDLYGHVAESAVTVTVTSNVAVESVVVGTPAVCYNAFSPGIWAPLYATHGPVPVARDQASLRSLFETADSEALLSEQRGMLRGDYRVLDTTLAEVATTIDETLTGTE